MEVKELRIGNWYIDMYGNESRATTISKYSDLGMNHLKAEPIPLTKEWLLKFGFDYVGDDDCGYNYRHSETRMVIWDRLDGLYFRSDLGDVKLECVHYFQNLFFCLTGKEVEINDRQ